MEPRPQSNSLGPAQDSCPPTTARPSPTSPAASAAGLCAPRGTMRRRRRLSGRLMGTVRRSDSTLVAEAPMARLGSSTASARARLSWPSTPSRRRTTSRAETLRRLSSAGAPQSTALGRRSNGSSWTRGAASPSSPGSSASGLPSLRAARGPAPRGGWRSSQPPTPRPPTAASSPAWTSSQRGGTRAPMKGGHRSRRRRAPSLRAGSSYHPSLATRPS
mmetsp:Transcript_4245/g.10279  ORF Transcript_4245/g.10279 Transcript_4245/m.10279 type:complete len:218 (-) Transcript_4245:232-885(-)